MQRNEFAMTFEVRKANDQYFVYVLTVDLESAEEGIYEKRGRIICFELTNSIDDDADSYFSSLMKSKTLNTQYNEPLLIQRSEFKIDDGALYWMNLIQERYLICSNKKIWVFDVTNPKKIILCKYSI